MQMPDYTPLKLTDEIKDLVNNSLTTGNPMVLAVVSPENKPILSFRGSTGVYSDTQLGVWARNTQGGTTEAIKKNPNVAMMYRSATVPLLQFQGKAHVVTDPATREKIFKAAPEPERNMDPEMKGIAFLIDLDKVEGVLGFTADGPKWCRMAR